MASGDVKVYTTSNNGIKAAIFDGIDDIITVGTNHTIANIFATGGTFCAKIMAKSDGEGGSGRIFDKSNTIIRVTGSDGTKCKLSISRVFTITTGVWTNTATQIPLNEWVSVIITYNESSTLNNPVIYINGVEKAITKIQTPAGTATSDLTSTGRIGNNSTSSATFWGGITNIKLFKRVLTGNEILQVSRGEKVSTTNQVAEWNFQNGTYADSVGTNDGTNTGTQINILDSAITTQIKAQRVTSTDRWLLAKGQYGQVISANIE